MKEIPLSYEAKRRQIRIERSYTSSIRRQLAGCRTAGEAILHSLAFTNVDNRIVVEPKETDDGR